MNASCAATLTRDPDHWVGRFVAMASPCEVLIDEAPASIAQQVLDVVASEAWRIERKFSRYRTDSAVHRINESAGTETIVDEHLARAGHRDEASNPVIGVAGQRGSAGGIHRPNL